MWTCRSLPLGQQGEVLGTTVLRTVEMERTAESSRINMCWSGWTDVVELEKLADGIISNDCFTIMEEKRTKGKSFDPPIVILFIVSFSFHSDPNVP